MSSNVAKETINTGVGIENSSNSGNTKKQKNTENGDSKNDWKPTKN